MTAARTSPWLLAGSVGAVRICATYSYRDQSEKENLPRSISPEKWDDLTWPTISADTHSLRSGSLYPEADLRITRSHVWRCGKSPSGRCSALKSLTSPYSGRPPVGAR